MKRRIGIPANFFNMLMAITCFIAVISFRTSNLIGNELSNGNMHPQFPISTFTFDHQVVANDDLVAFQNSTEVSCEEVANSQITLILLSQSSCFPDVI